MSQLDGVGIRSLVRGLTTAQRLGGSFKLVAKSPSILATLRVAGLDTVFPIFERVEPALERRHPWRGVALASAGVVIVAAFALAAAWALPDTGGTAGELGWLWGGAAEAPGAPADAAPWWQPFVELAKLVLAAAIGVVVTAIHRRYRVDRPQTQAMEQAQVLLCVSGAMMVEIEADGREFPTAHVQGVFARNRIIFEPREVSQGKDMCVRYHTLLDPDHSLDSLSDQLVDGGRARVKSVSWELPRKSE